MLPWKWHTCAVSLGTCGGSYVFPLIYFLSPMPLSGGTILIMTLYKLAVTFSSNDSGYHIYYTNFFTVYFAVAHYEFKVNSIIWHHPCNISFMHRNPQ